MSLTFNFILLQTTTTFSNTNSSIKPCSTTTAPTPVSNYEPKNVLTPITKDKPLLDLEGGAQGQI